MKAIKINLFNYGTTMCVGNFKNLNKYYVMAVRKPLAWLVLMRHNGGGFI